MIDDERGLPEQVRAARLASRAAHRRALAAAERARDIHRQAAALQEEHATQLLEKQVDDERVSLAVERGLVEQERAAQAVLMIERHRQALAGPPHFDRNP